MAKTLIATFSPFESSISTFLAKEFASKLIYDEIIFFDAGRTVFPLYTQSLHEELTGIRPITKANEHDIAVYDAILDKFISSDKIVLAFPNWNLGCPPNLLSFLLGATRLNKTFICNSEGYRGLLHNKKALIILSSGGIVYSDESCFALKQNENILKMNGISDISRVIADGFEQYPDKSEEIKERAKKELYLASENF